MRLCYIIIAHHDLKKLSRTISLLKDLDVDFVVHIDEKCTESTDLIVGVCKIVTPRIDVKWSDISVVESVLRSCEYAIQNCPSDYYILLSGDDYPVKSNSYIKEYIEKEGFVNHIEGVPLPSKDIPWTQGGYRRLFCYQLKLGGRCLATIEPRKLDIANFKQLAKVCIYGICNFWKAMHIWLFGKCRVHPEGIIPYGGEMWWMLNYETLTSILKYNSLRRDYWTYHQETTTADEIYFNTLVYNLSAVNKKNTLRYINWKDHYKNSPDWLTLEDKQIIDNCLLDKDVLFVRKVKDVDLIQYINSMLG